MSIQSNRFEQRAEYLSKEELLEWTADTPHSEDILSKLCGTGAKLLIGPRGSGKSTLLKRAFHRMIETGDALPAYINYSTSMALEPLFKKDPEALKYFRQWVIMRIIKGVGETYEHLDATIPSGLEKLVPLSTKYIRHLEKGEPGKVPDRTIAPSELEEILKNTAKNHGVNRCVLLMDDAAHAFSSEQQREFFEIFRQLRSFNVSPKAAVYPGITSYTPYFHIGNEAELVQVWLDPVSKTYIDTCKKIIDKRLTEKIKDTLLEDDTLFKFLALGSFGIPRRLIIMIADILEIDNDGEKKYSIQRKNAKGVLKDDTDALMQTFSSLSDKLPRYNKYVQHGKGIIKNITNAIRLYNDSKTEDNKTALIAIKIPLSNKLKKIVNFLEYSGILRRRDEISKGSKGNFQRFLVHYGFIIRDNALSLGPSNPLEKIVASLITQSSKSFARRSSTNIVTENFSEDCTLDLPPCQSCGAERGSEDALFCMQCGAELADASIYLELLASSISKLPLTDDKIERLQDRNYNTVEDILNIQDPSDLRDIPQIGQTWAQRITSSAEEYVYV